jgi:uncharacterized damage-inducible protein DinB
MHVTPDTLRLHIDYTIWASRKLLEAADGLTPDELTRDFGTADKSVLGTLLHVYGGDWVWIERMEGRSPVNRPYDQTAGMETLQTEWPRVWERWIACAGALKSQTAESEISYLTFKGDPYTTPVWQVILHVVNHGTHHRGQAAGFLRSLGKTPPVLDLTYYYRQLASTLKAGS